MSTLQFQFLILIIAGWVNRTQQDVIEYLEAENRVLREQLGDGRLLLTDGQRRRLAVRAKAIGRLLAHYGVRARERRLEADIATKPVPMRRTVSQLHGCRGVRAWLDTLDGLDSGLGKFSIGGFIEEFPDLVSRVSEVSSGRLASLRLLGHRKGDVPIEVDLLRK